MDKKKFLLCWKKNCNHVGWGLKTQTMMYIYNMWAIERKNFLLVSVCLIESTWPRCILYLLWKIPDSKPKTWLLKSYCTVYCTTFAGKDLIHVHMALLLTSCPGPGPTMYKREPSENTSPLPTSFKPAEVVFLEQSLLSTSLGCKNTATAIPPPFLCACARHIASLPRTILWSFRVEEVTPKIKFHTSLPSRNQFIGKMRAERERQREKRGLKTWSGEREGLSSEEGG